VLDQVKERRRFTWILLSQNAQVGEVADGVLTLSFSNAGAKDSFFSGGSDDILADVLVDLVGATLRVVGVVGEGSAQPREQRPHDDAGHVASHSREPMPEPEPPEPEEEVSRYDVEVGDNAASATELLTSQLGAEVIETEENV